MNLFHISVLKWPLVHKLLVNRNQEVVAVQSGQEAAFLHEDSAVTILGQRVVLGFIWS